MSEGEPRRATRSKFSILHLLTFTALIAVAIALALSIRKNRELIQQQAALRTLSTRLQIDSEDELASSAMPNIASRFQSWQVYVPESQAYELKLGLGAMSYASIPPVLAKVQVPAGKHRVTLFSGDSPSSEFRYVVYLDGEQVIEEVMGSDWIAGGWSSSRGVSWPSETHLIPAPHQLAAQTYEPTRDVGRGNYFNEQSDSYVTRLGYRLWIDRRDRTYPPASPFVGFASHTQSLGVGLGDGIRLKLASSSPYLWHFTRPQFGTIDPVLQMEAEFIADDGSVLSSQSETFQSWKIRNAATGEELLQRPSDSSQTTQTAFVHATAKADDSLQPVVEMKWDVAKPDQVGLRLADTPANDRIAQWRLRIVDGSNHLWRELRIGDDPWITPDGITSEELVESSGQTSRRTAEFKVGESDESTAEVRIQWQTNETLPLQIVGRKDSRYAGMRLYEGLPVMLGVEIPAALEPTLAVDILDQQPSAPATKFPGGPVFDAIQIELEATEHEWVWLSLKAKQ